MNKDNLDKPLEDQWRILAPTPEQKARARNIVQAHHQRSADVLDRSETPEEAARFKEIGYYDTVPVPATTLYKFELLALVRLWENEARRERFDEWKYRQSFDAMEVEGARNNRLEQVAAQIGIEAVWKALDEAFDEFDFHQRHLDRDEPALWRAFLSARNPKKYGPADPEALAARARLDRELETGQLDGRRGVRAVNVSTPNV
jgi:hypothetical protein